MMRKRIIDDQEREKIIRMRQSGLGWLQIQKETGVPRRAAKRYFEEYQRTQSYEEIKVARRQVASEIYKQHLRDLITIAAVIPNLLADPALRDRRNDEKVLDDFMAVGILDRDKPAEFTRISTPEVIMRHNRTLVDSLRQHTRGKINWSALSEGLESWNAWQKGIQTLESETVKLIGNYLKNERRDINNAQKTKSDEKLLSVMRDGVVETVYRAVLNGRVEEIPNNISMEERETDKFVIQFWLTGSTTEIVINNKRMVDMTLRICEEAAIAITKGKEQEQTLKNLTEALNNIRATRNQLAEELDELSITPQILLTKCDICPT
jgi:hypothetical protein